MIAVMTVPTPVRSPAPLVASMVGRKPSLVRWKQFSFLIMDAPSDANISAYIKEMKHHQVRHLVRTCEPTYKEAPLAEADIKLYDLPYSDGEPPPRSVIEKWIELVADVFLKSKSPEVEDTAIAIHCVAGRGRAPVLVAIALVEAGMEPEDAIHYIRQKRKGAINTRQMRFILDYQPKRRPQKCTVM
eukprot:TRINITY_DN15340_c0_g1::TRINITY_DN15340_c0_g1_i1::g.22771::m.22771 TRINITY_DN15340_c0_g1::TRINITY_DN15340_c0_g1_i1::g.22771  ORF type:complete len:187 (+),score=-5.32,sp/Q54DU9/TP4AA_DICDI/47.97/3e-46,DSPc/PF00782.15/5.8e-07,Y_phosphatase/PF00102.22/2.7e+02,Y_phosphatase/PF00102.22/2e-05,PTPlike_phytase/PF14566.1/0.00034,Y_phosphatase3/PF13350.1/0.015 TRINITY_DN15340_c0_g1_i1:40-600(+)